jgi:hypothetical protein
MPPQKPAPSDTVSPAERPTTPDSPTVARSAQDVLVASMALPEYAVFSSLYALTVAAAARNIATPVAAP